jgi:hypothetical protein
MTEKPFKLKRDGRKLTIEINCNSEQHCAQMYYQMLDMASKGVAIKLTIEGTGIRSGDV